MANVTTDAFSDSSLSVMASEMWQQINGFYHLMNSAEAGCGVPGCEHKSRVTLCGLEVCQQKGVVAGCAAQDTQQQQREDQRDACVKVIEVVDLVSDTDNNGEESKDVSKGEAEMSLDSDNDHVDGTIPAPYEPQSPVMPDSPQSWLTVNAHPQLRASANAHSQSRASDNSQQSLAPGPQLAHICIVADHFIFPNCDPDQLHDVLCAVEDVRRRLYVDCSLILHTAVYEEMYLQMLVTVDGIIRKRSSRDRQQVLRRVLDDLEKFKEKDTVQRMWRHVCDYQKPSSSAGYRHCFSVMNARMKGLDMLVYLTDMSPTSAAAHEFARDAPDTQIMDLRMVLDMLRRKLS